MMQLHPLLQTPLFQGVSEDSLQHFLQEAPNKLNRYHEGETIATQGKLCRSLYLLSEGDVRAQMTSAEGRLLTVGVISAPDLLAPAFVYGTNGRFPVSITAVNDCQVWSIDKERFLYFMQHEPDVLHRFLTLISDRGTFLSHKVNEFALQSLRSRLLNYLKMHDRVGNQQELANILGVARPSLARMIAELLEEGILVKDGKEMRMKG